MAKPARRPITSWPPIDESFWGEPDEYLRNCEESLVVDVRLLETPAKLKNDNKQYRVIELRNGLKALLITHDSGTNAWVGHDSRAASATESYRPIKRRGSDSSLSIVSTTDDRIDGINYVDVPSKRLHADGKMAAFGLSIGVGSYNDPPEVPGMARFLEHMIVIGSKKYPQEYGFDYFIKESGGYVDAFTGTDQTTFKATVPEQFLSDALDRFAQFFIEPLLKRAAVGRLRQLVIEHDNVTNEMLYEKLHRFRERYYRAHNITLTIRAGVSLDSLEKWVKDRFSRVPSESLPLDYFAEFTATDLLDISGSTQIYTIQSITDDPKIEIIWRIPLIYLLHGSKPLHYISWLICHNGKGSLISYFRKKGWCLSISSNIGNVRSCTKNYAQFSLSLFLTKEAFDNRRTIKKCVYSYINMIRRDGPQKRIYDEISKIEETKLRTSDEMGTVDPFDLCRTMHSTSPVDYVTRNYRYIEYDPHSIKACVDLLVPANANYVYYCSEVLNNVRYSQVEPWFKMLYGFIKETKENIQFYETAEPMIEFYFPGVNPFITDELNIIPAPENSPRYPIKIHSDAICEIWYNLNAKFKLPQCYLNFHYISPLPLALPENAAMLDLFVTILKPLVLEELAPATVAGFEYQLYSSEKGLVVEVHGFNRNVTLLMTTIARCITQCSDLVMEDLFAKTKQEQRAKYYNDVLSVSEELAEDTRLSIVRLIHWSTIQKRNAVSDIKLEEFKHFIKSFTYRTYIQCLGQGNIEGIDVIQNVQDCIATLERGALQSHVRPYMRLTEVPVGVRCCRVKSRDTHCQRSAVVNYYQLPNTFIRSTVEILNIMLQDPSFEEFRKQKRLDGYEYRLLMDPSDVFGYFIEGNSKFYYVCEIDEAIEKFRKSFNEILKELSEEEMLTAMAALVKAKRCTDICLKEEVARNWAAIISGSYVFDRLKREIDAISNLTITDLKSSIIDCTAAGPNLRKLSVQVVGKGDYETATIPTDGQDGDTDVYPLKRDRDDDPLEYLTDAPKAEKKIDYYITDIEEYKRKRVVLSVHSSDV